MEIILFYFFLEKRVGVKDPRPVQLSLVLENFEIRATPCYKYVQ